MCSNNESLLCQLKDLVCQIDDKRVCCQPSCSPCSAPCPSPCCPAPCGPAIPCPEASFPNFPFATVTMTVPPPIVLPTVPTPVKPLQLPCPCPCDDECPPMLPDYDRRANFYNYYNCDYKNYKCDENCHYYDGPVKTKKCCEDYRLKRIPKQSKGCPTGYKPCMMDLRPPPLCDPCGVWCAKVLPCPPKIKKHSCEYHPKCCTRPCCKHWRDPEGPCCYDMPCKAHCFNHPVGIKPRKRC